MAETVWKFPLREVRNPISLPEGAQLLTVAEQHGEVVLWARVDDTRPPVYRDVYLVGTGTEVPEEAGAFIGTAVCAGGSLVFHAFDQRETRRG